MVLGPITGLLNMDGHCPDKGTSLSIVTIFENGRRNRDMGAITMACLSSQCLFLSPKLQNLSLFSTQLRNSSLKPLTFSTNISQSVFSQGKVFSFMGSNLFQFQFLYLL